MKKNYTHSEKYLQNDKKIYHVYTKKRKTSLSRQPSVFTRRNNLNYLCLNLKYVCNYN